MKLRHLLLLTAVIIIAFVLQQTTLYLAQWDSLQTLRSEVVQLTAQIEGAMYQEAELRQQLDAAEQAHTKLRRLLPETLPVDELQQQIEALSEKHQITILASKTAIRSRPQYSEAITDITLEAGKTAATRFMRELKAIPQRIHILPQEKHGKKNVHLTIAIYAVAATPAVTFTPPHCIEMPARLYLPPLRERLARLHTDYLQQCRFVNRYVKPYTDQLHLLALQQENTRLQALETLLRRRP